MNSRHTRRRWAAAAAACTLAEGLLLASPAAQAQAKPLQLDGDAAALWYFSAAQAPNATDVGRDTHVMTLIDPRQPDGVKRVGVRATLHVRSASSGPEVFPQPFKQLLWTSKGKLYRMSLQDGLDAPAMRVSGLDNVCEVINPDPGERDDGWLLVNLADRWGRCPNSQDVAALRLVRAQAGPMDLGVALGHAPELRVLGMLHGPRGEPGPLLVHLVRAGQVAIADPSQVGSSGPDAVGITPLLTVTDLEPLQFSLLPGVAWQMGVLQANGQTALLDWRQGPPVLRPTTAPLRSGRGAWVVSGPWAGSYLLNDGTSVLTLNTQGHTEAVLDLPAPTEGDNAGWPTGLDVEAGAPCASVTQVALVPGSGKGRLLQSAALNPWTRHAQGLSLQGSAVFQARPDTTLVAWLADQGGQALQTLTRAHCHTGARHLLATGVHPLPRFTWYGPQGKQTIWPLLQPAQAGKVQRVSMPQGLQSVYTGTRLLTYNATRDTWVQHGVLPMVDDAHIIDLLPRPSQTSTGSWLFEAMLMNSQGQRLVTLIGVSAQADGRLQVLHAPLPWAPP